MVPGYGKGLVTYLTGDFAAATFEDRDVERTIEEFARIPFGQKLYLRPTWRDLQKRPGRLDPEEYWKVALAAAGRHGKRLGFRVMMSDPDIAGPALPDFVLEKVPMVSLEGEWKRSGTGAAAVRYTKRHEEPRYDHPFFQEAFRELVSLLAAELDGGPLVEYVDTFMYGFWGEGHTWPYRGHPFPDAATAEATFVRMFEVQLEHWKKTPLVTNTQPDWSRVGNSELVDRTVRSYNWLRTDTIFIENEQIEAISNRPPWVAAVLEVGMSDGSPESLQAYEGVTRTDNVITHVMDVGANYWSLWNWHRERPENVLAYYQQYPGMIDTIARRIGYRVRPSFVWHDDGGLVVGLANDGIAGVPGVLRLVVETAEGRVLASGGLDPGYPLPGRIRQARLPPPRRDRVAGAPPPRRAGGEGSAPSRSLGVPAGAGSGRCAQAATDARRLELSDGSEARRRGTRRSGPEDAESPHAAFGARAVRRCTVPAATPSGTRAPHAGQRTANVASRPSSWRAALTTRPLPQPLQRGSSTISFMRSSGKRIPI